MKPRVIFSKQGFFNRLLGNTVPASYQWFFDGTIALAGATSPTLSLVNVQPAEAGTYSVAMSNLFGSVTSSPALLTVQIPPFIGRQPIGLARTLGESAIFLISTGGTEPLGYQWRLDGIDLPFANQNYLIIQNVVPASGGQYQVIVTSPAGSAASATATLTVLFPPVVSVQPADASAPLDSSVMFCVEATGTPPFRFQWRVNEVNNRGATKQPGEADHAHKPGGSSVWYSWQAPAKGIATFRTSGSPFDTLLAIYSGSVLSELVNVASDEDRGGYLASALQFNTQAGAFYEVAIDGYAAAQGGFILSWDYEPTLQELPLILTQPRSQTVAEGAEVVLRVEASGDTLRYQWSFSRTTLEGATSRSLLLSSVRRSNVGAYSVHVTNGQLRTADSEPALVEIGPEPSVQSQDKLEDLFLVPANPLAVVKASATAAGLISVRAGTIGSHTLNNSSSTNSGRAEAGALCALVDGERRWFNLRAEDAGVLTIDTQGSAIDTLLGVFTLGGFAELVPVACNDNGGADGVSSLVRFSAVPGTDYLIGIDGAGGQTGVIQLNWSLGVPLSVQRTGSTLAFGWPASFTGFFLEEGDGVPSGPAPVACGRPAGARQRHQYDLPAPLPNQEVLPIKTALITMASCVLVQANGR